MCIRDRALAKIAKVDIETHAKNMFKAGSDFKNKTTEEIFYSDFKIFHTDEFDFGVAQISAMSREELDKVAEKLRPFLKEVLGEKRIDMVYVMLTDILEESSRVIFEGHDAGRILADAFEREENENGILLEDSICAAISYAYLKNQLGERQYVPKRAGAISEETRYVLDYFKVEDPELITDVGAQLKDISIRKTAGISSQISLKKAWETMKKLDVVTLPVTNRLGKLEGVIVTKDIATSYMDVYDNRVLSKARTQYKNIAETLDGNIIAGNEHAYFIRGKVVVGASDLGFLSEYIEADDMVILGPQKEVQIRALESNASCIIVGCGFEVDPEVIQMANKKDCVIITTPYLSLIHI